MELNAGHSHLSREFLFLIHSLRGRVSILLRGGCFILVTKHVKIVLEDIDDFVGLKGFLNSVSNLINKLFKLGVQLVVFSDSVLHAFHEIIGVIEGSGVDTTFEVSLSLQFLYLITSLQANFKDSSSLVRTLVLFVVRL